MADPNHFEAVEGERLLHTERPDSPKRGDAWMHPDISEPFRLVKAARTSDGARLWHYQGETKAGLIAESTLLAGGKRI